MKSPNATTYVTGDRLQARTRVATWVATMLSGVLVQPAVAVDLDYQIDLGVGHSDNIERSAESEQDENIASAGLRFSLGQNTPRTQADVVANLAYADYLDNTFDSELLGNLVGNARFALVPEKFAWVITENFGQVMSDPFQPATPDNRENVNYLTTGPDVTMAFGNQTALRLSGRYALATYEDRPLDFDSVSGEAGLIRRLSAAAELSFNGRYADTRYDVSALDADYEQTDAFVRYDITGARTRLAVDVGYSEIRRDAVENTEDGIVFHVDASRRLTSSSVAALRLSREFSNSAAAFASTQGGGAIGLQPDAALQAAQPFMRDLAALNWNFQRDRNSFSLSGSWSRQAYERTPLLDQEITQFAATFSRELSQRVSWSAVTAYARGGFDVPGADYDELQLGTSLRWQLSRHVSLAVTYDHFDRSSDLPSGEYKENRFWLSIGYGRGLPRATLAPPQFPVDRTP